MRPATLTIRAPGEAAPAALSGSVRATGGAVHLALVPGDRWILVREGAGKRDPWTITRGKDGDPIRFGARVEAIDKKAALLELRALANGAQLPLLPGRLKGRWSGRLLLAETGPALELQRDLTTYARIRVSYPLRQTSPIWHWRIVPGRRPDQWFARVEGEGSEKTAAAAFRAGLAACLDLTIAPSCTKRDSERRPKERP